MKSHEEYEKYGGRPPDDPPPDGPNDLRPSFDSLPPFQRRRELFARFLDAAEQTDVQLAILMAERARRIDALRLVSEGIAAEERVEDAERRVVLGVTGPSVAGWSIENRAKTELVTEIAAAFTLSKNAANHLLVESETLVQDLPLTLAALTDGGIRYEHARVIVQTAWSMPAEARAALEAELVPVAGALILATFRSRAVSARERLHSEAMEVRHERAAAFRNVTQELGADGMGYLSLHDSNETIAAIFNRVTDMALLKSKDDPRTLAQRRADVTTAILIDGDLCSAIAADAAENGGVRDGKPLGHGIVAQVHIEVPVLALLGHDHTPGTLEGIIPIDPVTARTLIANAPGFFRLLTDPVTGTIVAFDDTFRFLPASLRRAVRLIDGHCTSPWCNNPAQETEGHHPTEWQQTQDTSLSNSALACKPDHRLIHNTRWTMRKLGNGDKQWISPCGKIRHVAPIRRLSPKFVEKVAAGQKVEKPTEPAAAVTNRPDTW